MVGYSSKGGPTMVLAQGLYELLSQGVAHRSEWGEGGTIWRDGGDQDLAQCTTLHID